jgi:NADP-reducing hydrogenase subunit HndB
MAKIKSIEDLKRIREEAIAKKSAAVTSGQKEIVVGMGTVGIAAGARETLKAILDYIENENLSGIVVRQTGNIGYDSYEPIIQVTIGEEATVNYGRVTPEMADRIMKEHIVGGKVIKDFVIE